MLLNPVCKILNDDKSNTVDKVTFVTKEGLILDTKQMISKSYSQKLRSEFEAMFPATASKNGAEDEHKNAIHMLQELEME